MKLPKAREIYNAQLCVHELIPTLPLSFSVFFVY